MLKESLLGSVWVGTARTMLKMGGQLAVISINEKGCTISFSMPNQSSAGAPTATVAKETSENSAVHFQTSAHDFEVTKNLFLQSAVNM